MRRPARLERAGALTPRDRIWAAIRAFGTGDPFSVAEVMVLSEQRADTTLSYLRGLTAAGYLTAGAPRPLMQRREFSRFKLVRDIGVEAPRVDADGKTITQGIGREQLWRAMRILKTFDCVALAAAASTQAHQVAVQEAKSYVKFLARAGYLQLVEKSAGPIAARYRFVRARDTGPRAPLVARDKSVMDGNTGDVVYDPSRQLQGGEYDK